MNPNNKRDYEKVVMMGDVQHLILFRIDPIDTGGQGNSIKGTLVFKCQYRSILKIMQDEKDQRKLGLSLIRDEFEHFSAQRQSTIESTMNNANAMNDFSRNSDLDYSLGDMKHEIQLFFDDKTKADQSRTYIVFQRQQASIQRAKAVSTFLNAQLNLFDKNSSQTDENDSSNNQQTSSIKIKDHPVSSNDQIAEDAEENEPAD